MLFRSGNSVKKSDVNTPRSEEKLTKSGRRGRGKGKGSDKKKGSDNKEIFGSAIYFTVTVAPSATYDEVRYTEICIIIILSF